jgi:ferredoxin
MIYAQLLFLLCLATAGYLFTRRILQVRKNILSGRDYVPTGAVRERWKTMAWVALGQSKMVTRPLAGVMHFILYVGFVVINIELLEIVIDGLLGTHRIFAGALGGAYDVLIGSFEVLAAGVLVACAVFLVRRNAGAIARFRAGELAGWPSRDANIILVAEVLLMFAFLSMNAADALLQERGAAHYPVAGAFPVSQALQPLYAGLSDGALVAVERGMWWFHILGILTFLVYVTYSKHLHILLAFPNTYYSRLEASGAMDNMPAIQREVQAMLDPSAAPPAGGEAPARFGVRDVTDLTWKQLLEAYTCTECGRCSSVCPANLTGKKLSPRKIMMDTRDRMEERAKDPQSERYLLGNFITEEELWACTSCQACVMACPVNISPMGIILDMRRNLIMEESRSPESLTSMFNNLENNGAPWAFPAASRGDWTQNV